MSAYRKAVQLGITGTDAEIVAALQSTGLTANKILLSELLFLLNNRGMVVRLIRPTDTGEKWSGTVINLILYINEVGTQEQKDAINRWFGHITNERNTYFDTTDITASAPFWAMYQSFADQPTMPTSADFQAVADLGGGWLFAELTEAEYTAQREDAEADSAKADLEAVADGLYAAFAAKHNAAKTGISNGTITTSEQVTAAYQ